MPTNFALPDWTPAVPVQLTSDLSKDQLLSFPAFKSWVSTLKQSLALQQHESHPFHSSPYLLRKIEIQAADFFGAGRLGFLKLKAEVTNNRGENLPGSVFLRGGSVGMLLIVYPPGASDSEKYAILTIQPRIPAGSLSFAEIPAGMLDDSRTFAGGAAKEIKEETGLTITEDELIDMTALAMEDQDSADDCEDLKIAVYPSPGGSDEFIPLFVAQKELSKEHLDDLQGRLTGLRAESEKITLKLVPLASLWKEAARDGKTLAAWALFEGLRKEGKI